MSDEPAKRGRKAAAVEASPKNDSPKKRGRKEVVKPLEDEAPAPAKRGRGRPKGTKKKVVKSPKAKAGSKYTKPTEFTQKTY